MGEPQDRHIERRIVRGVRRVMPVDGSLPTGYSLPPDVVVLVPTLRCSLKCPYCFQRDRQNESGKLSINHETLLLADWQKIIDEIQPLGLPIIVMGGEIFLYPQAMDLLHRIKAANLPLTLITNGLRLPNMAAGLVNTGLNTLIVSIDGLQETHNALRGHSRSYQSALDGIRLVLEHRGICPSPFIQVSCTISPATQAQLYEFVKEMMNNRVDRVVFNNLIFLSPSLALAHRDLLLDKFGINIKDGRLTHQAQFGIDPGILRRELDRIRSSPWSDRVFLPPPGVEQNLEAYYHPDAPPFRDQRCSAAYRELWVFPDGSIAACGHLPELVMGNAKTDRLMVAWNGLPFRNFRQELNQRLLPGCARCEKLTYTRPPCI